jgi:hypothetical protein
MVNEKIYWLKFNGEIEEITRAKLNWLYRKYSGKCINTIETSKIGVHIYHGYYPRLIMWPEPEPKKSRIELLKELVFG